MARKRKPLPLLEGVTITDVAAEGKALARVNDLVVFVPYVAPGDIVDIQLIRKKHNYAEGKAVAFHKYAEERAVPFCEHFGVCGGCKWQHLPYDRQLEFKQQQVADQLSRIGKVELPPISPILGSAKQLFYRNKLEFTFCNKRWLTDEEVASGETFADSEALGFHIPNMFDKVLDIRKCWLQADPSNQIRMAIREFCVANGYSFYNVREHVGLMRNLIIRTASTGEVMVIVVFGGDEQERIDKLMNHIAELFPQITSLMYVVNTKFNDTIGDLDIRCFKGRDHIFEQMEGLQFKIGPKSFYQTNSAQAYELYKVAREFAELTGNEVVYDLYTGTGTIANFVARRCRKVVGVEYVPEAIEDAKVNSALNGIDNTVFYAGDMKDVLNDRFIEENGRPDVVILDPPRAGIHEDVAHTVLRAAPQRIVYVSCNPATQARDIAIFDADYRVTRIQPVDMFPHTHHVENVVQLVRR